MTTTKRRPGNKYSLKCSYYKNEFDTVQELVDHIVESGMDPNHEILKNGHPTGERAVDLIQF
jgi:hypothetical protein